MIIKKNQVGYLAQSGTSIVESILLLLIILPVCIFIPQLAKISDFKMTVPQTSRYLAWHTALTGTHLSEQEAQIHMQERILKSHVVAFQTNQQNTLQKSIRPFWVRSQLNPQSSPVINFEQDNTLGVSRHYFNAHNNTSQIIDRITQGISNLSHGKFNTGNIHILQHNTSFKIQNPGLASGPDCSGNTGKHLCMQDKYALFVDGLAADNSNEIINQVNSLKPFSSMEPVTKGIAEISRVIPFFSEGSLLENAPLHVAPDALPLQKLE